jgi:hypothetical protein
MWTISFSGKYALPLFRFASGHSLYSHPSTAAVARHFNYRILARLGPLRVISGHVGLHEKASALPLKADNPVTEAKQSIDRLLSSLEQPSGRPHWLSGLVF